MRWHDEVADDISGRLGVEARLAFATTPATPDELSPGERAQLPGGLRREDWLLGRAALKRLLGGGDTSHLRFPSRSLSLSHAGGLAVVAQVEGGQAGVGVDYEPWRVVDARTARFFLHPHERERAPGDADLLRLWTVKEALWKATPQNQGATLLDYDAADAAEATGAAVDRRGQVFRYASRSADGGWLTVAVCDAAA